MLGSPLATRHIPSPNVRERKAGEHWQYVILHGTWMADDDAVICTLTNAAKEVSSHYFITHTGEIVQLVSEENIAWHAGKSEWNGREMLNGCALGIEIGNIGPWHSKQVTRENQNDVTPDMWANATPYLPCQYTAVINLLRDIMARHPNITPSHILGHSEVSPGRKSDPGQHFEWSILAAAGVALPRPLPLIR
ncbi:MAG: N-acetylmuramoyl-L-alanine amidase [Alphaproteobacteria bacterium]